MPSEEPDLEDLIEIDKASYLETVCESLIFHQDAVQQIENALIRYFGDSFRYHVAHYENPITSVVFYKRVEPKLGYENEPDEIEQE